MREGASTGYSSEKESETPLILPRTPRAGPWLVKEKSSKVELAQHSPQERLHRKIFSRSSRTDEFARLYVILAYSLFPSKRKAAVRGCQAPRYLGKIPAPLPSYQAIPPRHTYCNPLRFLGLL